MIPIGTHKYGTLEQALLFYSHKKQIQDGHTQINGRKYASQYQLNPCLRLILEYGSQEIISIESKIDGWLEFDQLHHKRP